MHVMHIIDSMHGGGAETSILEIVPGLASRGVKTSIVTLVPDDGGLDGRLVSLGITCIKLNSRRPLGAVLKLRGIVRAENPRLLHTTLLFSNLAGRVAARATHKPVVTTLANLDTALSTGLTLATAPGPCDLLTVPNSSQRLLRGGFMPYLMTWPRSWGPACGSRLTKFRWSTEDATRADLASTAQKGAPSKEGAFD